MTINCVLPEQLQRVLQTYDEDDITVTIASFERAGDDAFCKMEIIVQEYYNGPQTRQVWTVRAVDVELAVFSISSALNIQLLNDHPLLWKFKHPSAELYFKGTCNDEPKLMHDLFRMHKSFFGDLEPFNLSGRGNGHKPNFYFSNGLLAYGPKPLMDAYIECLNRNGLEGGVVGQRDETGLTSDFKLLLFEPSYIIARNFHFSLVP